MKYGEMERDELAAELSGMDDKQLKELLDKLSREEEKISISAASSTARSTFSGPSSYAV